MSKVTQHFNPTMRRATPKGMKVYGLSGCQSIPACRKQTYDQNELDTLAELDVIVQRVNELNIGSARAAKSIAALGRDRTYDETAEALTRPRQRSQN